MKVLLVHPYFLSLDAHEQNVMKPYPPLGILYLSAFLKTKGFDVRVFDGTFSEPDAFFREVDHFQPDAIGFYVNMMTRHNALKLRAGLKSKALCFVGGPDTTHYVDAYLAHSFDAVILGEGELPTWQWLSQISNPDQWIQIPGLAFKQESMVMANPAAKPSTPIEEFPMPDRQSIHLNQYLDCWGKHHGYRPINLITARGCPFQCTWCSHSVFGYSLRKRSVNHVLAEMDWLNRHYDFNAYWFADDVFTIQKNWTLEFAQAVAQNGVLKRPYETITRADKVDEAVVEALQRSGCSKIWIGAESGSQTILDAMKRGVKRDQVKWVVQNLRRVGIQTGMFFMWGYTGEGLTEILDTIQLAEECQPDTALTTISYPIKGTPYYKTLQEQGLLGPEHDFENGTDRQNPINGRYADSVYHEATHLLALRLKLVKYQNQAGLRKWLSPLPRMQAWRSLRRLNHLINSG